MQLSGDEKDNLRLILAAVAMNGSLAGTERGWGDFADAKDLAKNSFECADALLAEADRTASTTKTRDNKG